MHLFLVLISTNTLLFMTNLIHKQRNIPTWVMIPQTQKPNHPRKKLLMIIFVGFPLPSGIGGFNKLSLYLTVIMGNLFCAVYSKIEVVNNSEGGCQIIYTLRKTTNTLRNNIVCLDSKKKCNKYRVLLLSAFELIQMP